MRPIRRHDGELHELEQRLRDDRPVPPVAFLEHLGNRIGGRSTPAPAVRRSRGTPRLVLAGIATTIVLSALAATGGLGQAASGGKQAVVSVGQVVAAPFSDRSGFSSAAAPGDGRNTAPGPGATKPADAGTTTTVNGGGGTGNGGPGLTSLTPVNNPPGQDQYKPGCGDGDPNHSHTGPPGNHNGFPDRCPPSAPPPKTP